MNSQPFNKKHKYPSSENSIKLIPSECDKLIEAEQQVKHFTIQRLSRNRKKIEELQEKVSILKADKAKKIHQLDEMDAQIKECKEQKELLPLIQQLREHYKKLIEQLKQQYYYEDEIDVDQMSYEQLL
jgi:chromosome segregation ATPase